MSIKKDLSILKIVIQSEWFDAIASGEKKTEYREIKPFWESRLYNPDGSKRNYDRIEFINGYNKGARRMFTQYGGFTRRDGKFHIKVGKILKRR